MHESATVPFENNEHSDDKNILGGDALALGRLMGGSQFVERSSEHGIVLMPSVLPENAPPPSRFKRQLRSKFSRHKIQLSIGD
jgi:hypothetical protein